MQIFNCDETGVGIVHKPGKVIAELGRRNVHSVTSAERGKIHTVLSCVSASGYTLPPMIVYPRKKSVPEKCREEAMPNTLFTNSANGWINGDLFLLWFEFFLRNIPPARPVLLILDGHGSHVSIDLIELARSNGVDLLCLPSHTTHILQPLDVGVFKSFKTHFSKACSRYISANPGRVITADKLASLIAEAWPHSFTALNIMSGFRKCGVFPFNPSAVTDRQIAPSKVFHRQSPEIQSDSTSVLCSSPQLFSPEKEALFRKRYDEGYDIKEPEYVAWLKINHPETDVSTCSTGKSPSISSSSQASHSSLSEILVLPQCPKPIKRKQALNAKTVCITEDAVLEELKQKAEEKAGAERQKEVKRLARLQKKKEKEEKRLAAQQRKKDKEVQRKKIVVGQSDVDRGDQRERTDVDRGDQRERTDVDRGDQRERTGVDRGDQRKRTDGDKTDVGSSEDEDDAICPACGASYANAGGLWISCDNCLQWYDFKCTKLRNPQRLPKSYICCSCKA